MYSGAKLGEICEATVLRKSEPVKDICIMTPGQEEAVKAPVREHRERPCPLLTPTIDLQLSIGQNMEEKAPATALHISLPGAPGGDMGRCSPLPTSGLPSQKPSWVRGGMGEAYPPSPLVHWGRRGA